MPARDIPVTQIQITFGAFKNNFIRLCTALDQLAEWSDQHFYLDVPDEYHELYYQLEAIKPLINPLNPDANGHTYPVDPIEVEEALAPEEVELDNPMEIDDEDNSSNTSYVAFEIEAKASQTAADSTLFDSLREEYVKTRNYSSNQRSHGSLSDSHLDNLLYTLVENEVQSDKNS